ncbi:AraC family transcriptional regulator [Niabella ginsenosidivorans]|uniref:AraC family transcriptional regulator n=1 Tax=Niabella ginsenosidivorans TaxID=1176587 RepID=A0A1A9I5M9_9BACT|nr:helix-turn-helix transcriptional regulator [Niabella ginsenosidivorans]ANH81992.1 AraC family transcriptional regulator [Niabella ginsenosidivorans]
MGSTKKIPVYSIRSLQPEALQRSDFLAAPFALYLEQHYEHLHRPHRHSFYHMVLFTSGKGTHTVDFSRFEVQPFQVYCMTPGQVHSWHFTSAVTGYVVNFSEHFFRDFLLNPYYPERFSFFSGVVDECVFRLPEALHTRIVRLLEDVIRYAGGEAPQQDMVRVWLLEVFLLMENGLTRRSTKAIPEQKKVLLQHLRRLIDSNYKLMRLPKEYADLLYVTPNHLNALCRDLLGMTAGELIRNRVLLEAKRLLTNVNMTVAEIAYELDFQDNSYFNRFFKKYEGITPDAFRNNFLK